MSSPNEHPLRGKIVTATVSRVEFHGRPKIGELIPVTIRGEEFHAVYLGRRVRGWRKWRVKLLMTDEETELLVRLNDSLKEKT